MKSLILVGATALGLSVISLYILRYRNKVLRRRVNYKSEISIDNNVIGHIIGRDGVNLKRIISISGAQIRIFSDILSKYSLFLIEGSRNEVHLAKTMISQVLKNPSLDVLSTGNLEKASDYEFLKGFSKKLDDELNKSLLSNANGILHNISDLQDEISNFAAGHTQKLYSVSDDGFIPVYVSAVANPQIFWVQAVKTKEHIELDQLTEKLCEYYKTNPDADVPPNFSDIKVGLICATYFEQDRRWYRTEIADILSINEETVNETTIDLYFLDYGESSYQKVKNIRMIPSKFLELKFQAIECGLSNVKPIDDIWSEESVSFFEEITRVGQWYTLMARVDSESEDGRPNLTLIDVNSEEDINIADRMVSSGFAQYCSF